MAATNAMRALKGMSRDGKDIVLANPMQNRLLAELGGKIASIENRVPKIGSAQGPLLSLGIGSIDAMLATGAPVPARALHEVRAASVLDAAAATVFAMALGLRAAGKGSIFWISEREARAEAGRPYGPGLAALGLCGADLVRIEVRRTADALWAAGEIAAAKGAGLCLLELRGNPQAAGLAFSRRLALRAREAGVPVLLLRQSGGEEASAALTRWQIAPAPSRSAGVGSAGRKWVGPPSFAVTLEKCRGAGSASWIMEWNRNERAFELAGPAGGLNANLDTGEAGGFGPPGARSRPPLSVGEPAAAFDRPDRAAAPWSGLAARRSA